MDKYSRLLNQMHRRYGHMNSRALKRVIRDELDIYIPRNIKGKIECIWCDLGKMKQISWNTHTEIPSNIDIGYSTHTDQEGPISPKSRNGNIYIITFTDTKSRYTYIYFIPSLDHTQRIVKKHLKCIKTHTGKYPHTFYCDGHKTYLANTVRDFFENKGTEYHIRTPHVPEQNAIPERKNRTLLEGGRVLLIQSGLPAMFWEDAVSYIIYMDNRTPKYILRYKTPYEVYYRTKPQYENIHTFGCLAVCLIPKPLRNRKFDPVAECGIYLGPAAEYPGHKILFPNKRKVRIVRHVKFYEYIYPHNPNPTLSIHQDHDDQDVHIQEIQHKHIEQTHTDTQYSIQEPIDTTIERITDIDTQDTQDTANMEIPENNTITQIEDVPMEHDETEGTHNIPTHTSTNEELHRSERRNRGKKKLSEEFIYYTLLLYALPYEVDKAHIEPKDIYEALSEDLIKYWLPALQKECDALDEKKVFGILNKRQLKKIKQGHKVHHTKVIFKIKYDENGKIARYKIRIVVQGFSMDKGIDYTHTYSPCARQESIRLLLAISVQMNWIVKHIDLPNAYVNAPTEKEIFVTLPLGWNRVKGFSLGKDGDPVVLLKALYGSPDAGRLWNILIHKFILDCGYLQSKKEPCIYYRFNSGKVSIIVLWVDDIFYTGNDIDHIDMFEKRMISEFKARILGQITFAIGIAYEYRGNTLYLNQHAYIDKIEKEFKLTHTQKAYKVYIPLSVQMKKDCETYIDREDEKVQSMKYPYRNIIGTLLYLALNTRPDIAYAVGFLARFMNKVNQACIKAIENVVLYILYTRTYKMKYTKDRNTDNNNHLNLNTHVDSSWADCKTSGKSTQGYTIRIGNNPIIWKSILENTVATSSMVAELFASRDACMDTMWIQHIINEIFLFTQSYTPIYIDNRPLRKWAKQEQSGRGTRHVDVSYHYVKELEENGQIRVKKTSSLKQIADALTKPVDRWTLLYFLNNMNICHNISEKISKHKHNIR
jgi:hypothetical protein